MSESPALYRATLIFDGDCGFCRRTVQRLQTETSAQVDFEPFQSASARFPRIPEEEFARAVVLIEPDGRITKGAEAVFRVRKLGAGRGGWLWLYERVPGVRWAADTGYTCIARHRGLVSWMVNLLYGPHVGAPTYFLTRWLFLKCLAIIFFLAFLSLRVQVPGLIGASGILPIGEHLTQLEQYAQQNGIAEPHWRWPSLVWFNHSDHFLTGLCDVGMVTAMLACIGLLPGLCFALMWVIYLSLYHAGQTFLSFQWDLLLLETGFLAIFFAPWRLVSSLRRDPPPSRIVLWLLRLLLFKLMFLSGAVKLIDDHPVEQTWHRLEALNFHYETQCIPNAVAWYAHQLPAWFHKTSTLVMFVVELAVPFLIFLPRRPRLVAFLALVLLQLLIILTGNYTYFNLLTIVLCISLLDALYLKRVLPNRLVEAVPGKGTLRRARWPRTVLHAVVATIVVSGSAFWLVAAFREFKDMPAWSQQAMRTVMPFGSLNSYGLFRHMTTTRPEVVIEGSADGVTWLEYEFKYKPGDVTRRPPQVAPHQPRLDWQMWFAALSSPRHQPWIIPFMKRLLEASAPVLDLLDKNPFPGEPPRFVRARLYQYRFTDWETRRTTGAWWTRTLEREYVRPLSLESFRRTPPK